LKLFENISNRSSSSEAYREDRWCGGFLDTNFRFAQVLLENRIQSVFE